MLCANFKIIKVLPLNADSDPGGAYPPITTFKEINPSRDMESIYRPIKEILHTNQKNPSVTIMKEIHLSQISNKSLCHTYQRDPPVTPVKWIQNGINLLHLSERFIFHAYQRDLSATAI